MLARIDIFVFGSAVCLSSIVLYETTEKKMRAVAETVQNIGGRAVLLIATVQLLSNLCKYTRKKRFYEKGRMEINGQLRQHIAVIEQDEHGQKTRQNAESKSIRRNWQAEKNYQQLETENRRSDRYEEEDLEESTEVFKKRHQM